MSKGIFVTGTGTDVGKTYVTGLLLKRLVEEGCNAGYYKAAMSGNVRRKDGSLVPGDALFVKEVANLKAPLEEMCPYVYENAYSPHLASRIEGNPVKMDIVKAGYEYVKNKYDYVVVEGSGGILCPIEVDNDRIFLEDVIKELSLSTIIIADAGLGTINSVGLTVAYMKSKGIGIKGIIYNNYHKENVMENDNIAMCEKLTGIKTLATVAAADRNLDIDIDTLVEVFE